jgi:hypothetical protein
MDALLEDLYVGYAILGSVVTATIVKGQIFMNVLHSLKTDFHNLMWVLLSKKYCTVFVVQLLHHYTVTKQHTFSVL